MTIYRVLNAEGREVSPGDTIIDFRGHPVVFKGVGRAPDFSRSGKVYVEGRLGWFNDSVFKLQIARRVEYAGERVWLTEYRTPETVHVVSDDGISAVVPAGSCLDTEEL